VINLCLPSGDNFGWGVAGTHISAEIAKKTAVQPLTAQEFPQSFDDPVIQAVQGANLLPLDLNVWSTKFNLGLAFIEDRGVAAKFVENGKRYFDHIAAGSTWCADMLTDIGLPSVSTAIQGVDSELFKPNGVVPVKDKFVILSAGKFEYRKGQDIVIAAFKRLMKKYPDMHLLTCWGNLWPETMASMSASKFIEYYSKSSTSWMMKRQGRDASQRHPPGAVHAGQYTPEPPDAFYLRYGARGALPEPLRGRDEHAHVRGDGLRSTGDSEPGNRTPRRFGAGSCVRCH
jgi:hypothetical protein